MSKFRAFVRSTFKLKLSAADLLALAQSDLDDPPSILDISTRLQMSQVIGGQGRTTLDVWRDGYRFCLNELASRSTWQEQRAQCLRLCVNQLQWIVIGQVIDDFADTSPWAHYTTDHPSFEDLGEGGLKSRARGRFYQAILTYGSLVNLGEAAFHVGHGDTGALNVYRLLYKDFVDVETKSLDYVHRYIRDAERDEDAEWMADVFKREIEPFTDEYRAFAEKLADDICAGRYDGPTFLPQFKEFDRRRSEFTERFVGGK